MMIVELIDGDDFRSRLQALDIRLPEHACPETCARMAIRKHLEVGVPGLPALIEELMAHTDVMLPSVRQAIERFMLPALR
ncbi:MAG: hypothetical protein AWU55_1473 [Halomonadaceae bacterium T82-2]|nr:MAG: hypothetical protein AWU55_1473 [Halomonadaceae bacterium T82-2]